MFLSYAKYIDLLVLTEIHPLDRSTRMRGKNHCLRNTQTRGSPRALRNEIGVSILESQPSKETKESFLLTSGI